MCLISAKILSVQALLNIIYEQIKKKKLLQKHDFWEFSELVSLLVTVCDIVTIKKKQSFLKEENISCRPILQLWGKLQT